ncbi:MAG: cell envelope integrity protein TolA [Bacteroidales bacterium]|nr:cell envelope integrity protein TolA [Bacteroidales bacterium]
MNNESKKDKIISLCITIAVHALVIVLLVFLGFKYQAPEEESGILLMAGEVELSSGNESARTDASDIVEPTPAPEPVAEPTPAPMPQTAIPEPAVPEPAPEQPLIAQNIEDAPALAEEKKKKEEEAKRKAEEEVRKKKQAEEAKRAEDARLKAKAEEEAKRKAEEEAKRKAEEEAKRKAEEEARRKAEEEARKRAAAQNLVTGAFGKNSGTGNVANGVQGSVNGNNPTGASRGNAGYGDYDLGGRGIVGSLPKPTFNVNANGKVVVRITVNGNGQVIAAEPTSGTTIANQTVRSAAVEAAKKARFAVKEGAGNVTGTITYYFDSNN